MKNATTLETYEPLTIEQLLVEQSVVFTKPAHPRLPTAPFPHKYIHSTFVKLLDAKQAAQALRAAGIDEHDIYILEGGDFIEVMSQGQSAIGFLSSMDCDVYMREANRGHAFLAVRPTNYSQLMQIRDLLAPHRAHHVKYIDTWTVSELLP